MIGIIDDLFNLLLGHRDRPTRNMAQDVWRNSPDNLNACHLADSRARDAAGVNLDFYPPPPGPLDVAFSLTVWQKAVVIKDELDQTDPGGRN